MAELAVDADTSDADAPARFLPTLITGTIPLLGAGRTVRARRSDQYQCKKRTSGPLHRHLSVRRIRRLEAVA